MIPGLVTKNISAFEQLQQRLLQNYVAIEHWFRQEWIKTPPPFYCSVDLRNASYKLSVVDTNLFPGGFNNLSPTVWPLAVQAAMVAVEKICPDSRRLIIIPENHSRNLFYLQNVYVLQQLLSQAGMQVRVGSVDTSLQESKVVEFEDGKKLLIEPLQVIDYGGKKFLGLAFADETTFIPCALLLNHDLSNGVPALLQQVHLSWRRAENAQSLLVPLQAGWFNRRKSQHFAHYQTVVEEFAALLNIDPWLFSPYFAKVSNLDFHTRAGEEDLAQAVDGVLAKTAAKYKEYGIDDQPFVVIKADAGTYGMGIMVVKDAAEVRNLNRKTRNKMSVIKDGSSVSEVIVQEGVRSYERINEASAEPVVYMIDKFVVGGFYRVHQSKGDDENLNAPGAHFVPLAFDGAALPTQMTEARDNSNPDNNRYYTYGIVARLALLAAARELMAW